jgi:DNA-binding response OmpR family regulator
MDRARILIIDDERDFTEIVSTLLDFHDFQADTASSAQDALAMMDKTQYDLIVSDLMMPAMDGFQLIDKLREDPRYHSTPVVVLSAKTLTDEERKRLLIGNASFMTKPFEPRALVEKITQMLS